MTFQCDAFDQQIGLTNAPLTEHEAKHVKSRYHLRRNRVLEIDKILTSGSSAHHGQLLDERAQIIAVIQRYRIALSPHKRLHVEILQGIFHYVSAGYDQTPPTFQDPPLVLCRICSSWRRIAINMPELWKSIHFSAYSPLTRLQKLEASQTWFSRAGELGISLTLADTPDDLSPSIDFVKELIYPFCCRFKYLHLILQPPQIKALLSLPPGSLDSVEEFHLVYNILLAPTSPIPAWESPITSFSPSANLRRIRLQLTPFVMPYIFTFPWDRLESFRCDSSLQAEHCHEMLLSCQALQKIHVRVFGIKYSPLPTVEIPLPNLVSFSVQLCDQENYDLFFLPLILPALRSLWIYNYDGVAWSHGMYNGLLERSGCSIEHIYLGTIDAETRDVLTLFQRSPSLTSVTFSHNTIITPEILYMIGRGEVGGSLVQLFLKGIHELDPILTMLELRRSVSSSNTGPRGNRLSDSSLKFIETYCTPGEILAHANRIESLRGSGFEISLLKSVEGYFQL